MASRLLSDLDPRLWELARQHEDLAEASGVRLLIYCTWRSKAEQRALYAQGRLPLDTTNAMRKEAGLDPITLAENRRKVTWLRTGSKHNATDKDGKPAALAYDACPLDAQGHLDWDTEGLAWAIVVAAGERLGLAWGGDWERPDGPHWQLPWSAYP